MKKHYIQPAFRVVYVDMEWSVLMPASNPVQSQSCSIELEPTGNNGIWGSSDSNDDYLDWGN